MRRSTSARRRLLVVDDNKDSADSLAMLLELQGHEVYVAYDGITCLQLAQRLVPDLIFLDIGLPNMNGYEVADRFKQAPDLRGIPLVALSGFGKPEDLQRSTEAGFVAHLVKPIDPESLDNVIATHTYRD